MEVLKLPDYPSFVPSTSTIDKIRLTRKIDLMLANQVKPGLIGCYNYASDKAWFYVCVVLEIVGLAAILMNRLPPQAAIPGLMVALMIDCALAWWMHALLTGRNSVDRAEAIALRMSLGIHKNVDQERNDSRADELDAKVKTRKLWAIIPALLLIIFALVKIVAYAGLNAFRLNMGLLMILVSYIIVAYIHLTVTGYWLGAITANRGWRADIRKHQAGLAKVNQANESERKYEPIDFSVNSAGIPETGIALSQGGRVRHKISRRPETDASASPGKAYRLESWGVLTDEDIVQMLREIPLQDLEARQKVAFNCMAMQLNLFGQRSGGQQ